MEKLIDLLSRYGKDDDWCLVRVEGNVRKFDERLIISKSYGFIKSLVEKDKINIEKLLNIQKEYFILQVGNDNYNSENYFVDGLIMLLAIQDEPIEFLISILK